MATEKAGLDTIVYRAVEMPSAEDRASFIAHACGDDSGLRDQVENLVAAHFAAGSFMEKPAASPFGEEGAAATQSYAPIDESPGTVIGPYKLLQQIGEGGMGTVFMAEQEQPIRRKVALKLIKPGMDSRQVVARFEAERRALAEMTALGIDTRSGIYSLGRLLYELLTGSTPLSRRRLREAAFGEMLRMIKEEEPQRPSTKLSSSEELPSVAAKRHMEPAKLTKLMRGELDWIVMKSLEKDRNRRYETANGFAADVQRYLSDEAVLAFPPSRAYRVRKFVRSKPARRPASTCLPTGFAGWG